MDKEDKMAEIIDMFAKNTIDDNVGNSVNNSDSNNHNNSNNANINQTISGNENVVAGRDVVITEKVIKRNVIAPSDNDIKSYQQYEIQQRIYELADRDVTAGKGEVGSRRRHWFSEFKRKFKLASYKTLNQEQYPKAIQWLKEQKAIKRKSLRRKDNVTWRNDHYAAIFARGRQLGYSKSGVHSFAEEKLGITVNSLKDLGERSLKKLYNIIMSQKV